MSRLANLVPHRSWSMENENVRVLRHPSRLLAGLRRLWHVQSPHHRFRHISLTGDTVRDRWHRSTWTEDGTVGAPSVRLRDTASRAARKRWRLQLELAAAGDRHLEAQAAARAGLDWPGELAKTAARRRRARVATRFVKRGRKETPGARRLRWINRVALSDRSLRRSGVERQMWMTWTSRHGYFR